MPGHVYDAAGHEISLKDLQVGDVVHVTGRIRATKTGKSHQDRAVFDDLTLVPR